MNLIWEAPDSDSIKIIFGNLVYSYHTILNIKFGVNRTFHVPKTPIYRFDLYESYQNLWTDIAHFQYLPTDNRSLFAKFEVHSTLRSDTIVSTTDGQADGGTGRHSSNVLEFRAVQMSSRNLGSTINISRCYTRIDNTNIPSMRRV